MHELRTFLGHQLRAAICVVAFGCLVPLQVVQAQEIADPAFNRFRSQVVGNTVNFSYGSGGAPLGGAGNATGIGVSSGVDVGRGVAINTKHGPVNGTLTQKISNGAMGKAFGRAAALIGGPVGLAFLALPAIVDWMQDAGVRNTGTGFEANDPTICTVAPCYRYQVTQASTGAVFGSSPIAACQAWLSAATGVDGHVRNFNASSTATSCRWNGPAWGGSTPSIAISQVSAPPAPDAYAPVNNTQLQDRMGMVTPSPEALAELYKLGHAVPAANPVPDLVDTLRAEFEARSPESTETSSTSTPTEDKTETKTCATYTQIVGSTLSLVEQCETSTTTQPKDPATGLPVGSPTTTTTTTGSTTPDPATREEQAQDPCINAPNRVACIELGTPEGDIPRDTRDIDFEPEELFGGGSCPSDQTFTFRSSVIPITNYAQACDLLQTYVRPMAILLAFFAAMMILARGMPE